MKHTIEIEGLPEGWEPVAYREACPCESILTSEGVVTATIDHTGAPWLILKKKQPHRIVLEETDEERDWAYMLGDKFYRIVEDSEALPEFLKPQAD